jgi:hypothetical protein
MVETSAILGKQATPALSPQTVWIKTSEEDSSRPGLVVLLQATIDVFTSAGLDSGVLQILVDWVNGTGNPQVGGQIGQLTEEQRNAYLEIVSRVVTASCNPETNGQGRPSRPGLGAILNAAIEEFRSRGWSTVSLESILTWLNTVGNPYVGSQIGSLPAAAREEYLENVNQVAAEYCGYTEFPLPAISGVTADPAEVRAAAQGVVITITGANFPEDANVEFLLGDQVDGSITIVEVMEKTSTSIKVKINIAADNVPVDDPNTTEIENSRTVRVSSTQYSDQLYATMPDALTVLPKSGDGGGPVDPLYTLLHDQLKMTLRLTGGWFGGRADDPPSLYATVVRAVRPNAGLEVNLGSADNPVVIFGRENALAGETTNVEWLFYFLGNYGYSHYGNNHMGGFEAGTSVRGHLVSEADYDLYLEPYLNYQFNGGRYNNPVQYLPNGYNNRLRAGLAFGSDDLVKDWLSARMLFVESEFNWFHNDGFGFGGANYDFPFEGMPNGGLTSYLIRGGTDLNFNLSQLSDCTDNETNWCPDIQIVLAGLGGQSAIMGFIDAPDNPLVTGSTISNAGGFEGDLTVRFSQLQHKGWGDLALALGGRVLDLEGFDPIWNVHGSVGGTTPAGRFVLGWDYNNGIQLVPALAPMSTDVSSVNLGWTWPRSWFRGADGITLQGGVHLFDGRTIGEGFLLFDIVPFIYGNTPDD